MSYNFYEFLSFFFVYGFLGWVAEVAFAAVKKGEFVNRGFLLGPICPIYGVGVTAVILILSPFKANFAIEYILCAAVCSVLELLTGMILRAVFHERFWDYSDMKFNIGGYICLTFSLLWGAVCMIILHFLHPLVYTLVKKVPFVIVVICLAVFSAMLIADILITVIHALKIDKRMRMIDEMSQKLKEISDHLGKEISDKTIMIKEKTEERNLQRKEIAEKYKALIEKKNIVHEHLFKSFTNLEKGKYRFAYEKILKHKNQMRKRKKNR